MNEKSIPLRRLLIPLLTLVAVSCSKTSDTAKLTRVRIGWQTPLAIQGQIVAVLKNTPILRQRGLAAEFVPFSFGGPQTEAALAGALDVIFVGDQPAINLVLRGAKWKIVSRLFYTKTALMIPPESPIASVRQLSGTNVAVPFGSVAHREAIFAEQAAGLVPSRDVINTNLDILEASALVSTTPKNGRWRNISAVGVWEPSTTLFQEKKLARVLTATRTLGVTEISHEWLAGNDVGAVKLHEAILEAWAYFAAHHDQANRWYIENAHLGITPAILDLAAAVDPNYNARDISAVDLTLRDNDIAALQKAVNWSVQQGFSKQGVDIRSFVDVSYLKRAQAK